MSVLAVAEKDFRDAIRSRLIIVVAVMFVAFTGGGVVLGETNLVAATSENLVGLILAVLLLGTSTFIPLVAIGVAYRAIAGERASGSLKVLLSLPNSRLDVILGKFLGRSAVISLAILVGFVSMILAAALTFSGDIQAEVILGFMLTALFLAIVFVSVAVGVSAFSDSTFIAAVGSFGLWVFFQFAWNGVLFLIGYVVNVFEAPDWGADPPTWVEVLIVVNPMTAFEQSTRWLLRRLDENREVAQESAEAFYLEPWFGFVVLALWIVLPLVVGYLRFESADL